MLAIKMAVYENPSTRFLLAGSANILTIPHVGDSPAGRMRAVRMLSLARKPARLSDSTSAVLRSCSTSSSWSKARTTAQVSPSPRHRKRNQHTVPPVSELQDPSSGSHDRRDRGMTGTLRRFREPPQPMVPDRVRPHQAEPAVPINSMTKAYYPPPCPHARPSKSSFRRICPCPRRKASTRPNEIRRGPSCVGYSLGNQCADFGCRSVSIECPCADAIFALEQKCTKR